jgi:hypothetical protein
LIGSGRARAVSRSTVMSWRWGWVPQCPASGSPQGW